MSASLLVRHRRIVSIVGDIVRVDVAGLSAGTAPRFGDLALVQDDGGRASLAQIVRMDRSVVSLQLFGGADGYSTRASVTFLGHPPETACSTAILGRVFDGLGRPIDGGPDLALEPRIGAHSAVVNPARRQLASRMIRTDVPMIDLFNTLVESQKIPVFATAGEPYNPLLARIGVQADADVVVFAGLGLTYDDLHQFRTTFEAAGAAPRMVMFVNLASDPVMERLITPDLALAVAERFAQQDKKRVLVLLTDMTAFADALKEIGIAMDRIPANRGYLGDLYSQLARRYERACDFKGGGSLTVLAATTLPGGDITHPVPDNTGYITEGQIYLRDGRIDPFGSLSRLKQHVIGKETREDHGPVMNAMIRLYAGAQEARQKAAMAFELTDYDRRLMRYGERFRDQFMALDVRLPLEAALDAGWQLMADCFSPDELQIKPAILERYHPSRRLAGAA
jgi:V/A-type H+-transporting ATPase subunit B